MRFRRTMRPYVVATAGHVDHGKTALVRALTGVDTDRLPEEKARAITIELGFAPWDLGDGVRASVIDVPGHRRLVRAMIAGMGGIDLVLLVVAANEGVMPQTREHAAICRCLGIEHAVVALTKADAVGADLVSLATEEARALLGPPWSSVIVPCSARTGRGLDALAAAASSMLRSLAPRPPPARARVSIDRVFAVRGAGTVVTGTLVEGTLSVGGPLYAVGARGARPVRVRGLHVHGVPRERVDAPTRVAVHLAGASVDEVHRGDVLTDDAAARATVEIDAVLTADRPPGDGVHQVLHAGTAHAAARVVRVERSSSGRALARLKTVEPIVVFPGDRFVLRGADFATSEGAPVAGAVALDVHPSRTRRAASRVAVLAGIEAGRVDAALRALVEDAAPRPVDVRALPSRFPFGASSWNEAAERLEAARVLSRLPDGSCMDRGSLSALASTARDAVREHLVAEPLARGLPVETLRARLGSVAGQVAAEEAIRLARAPRHAADDGALAVDGDVVTIRALAGQLDARAADRVHRVERTVREAAQRGITDFGVGAASGGTPRETAAVLARLARERRVVRAGDLWFSADFIAELSGRVVRHLRAAGRMTVADFKALTGLGRRQAIVLLELFDHSGVTRRVGDVRELTAP